MVYNISQATVTFITIKHGTESFHSPYGGEQRTQERIQCASSTNNGDVNVSTLRSKMCIWTLRRFSFFDVV